MSRRAAVNGRLAAVADPAGAPNAAPSGASSAAPTLVTARVVSLDPPARVAVLQLGHERVAAHLDEALEVAVVETALARGERLLVERVVAEGGARLVVLGALRTSATPGVDEISDLTLRASRLRLEAEHTLLLRSGEASTELRAHGRVETRAVEIVSRATETQRLVGRLVRLN
jgi:hypothetical protein